MGGTHRCSRASLPMRRSVDGSRPPLLPCPFAHALERRWEAPTLAHMPPCPCAGALMGGTHRCSRAFLLSANAPERGWESPTLAHVPLCPCAIAWMGGTQPCSRASLPMRWSVDGRHPRLLTCLFAHALERGWEAPNLAHVPLCPCAGVRMGVGLPCSRASFPVHYSVDGRHPPLLTCLSVHAPECGWEAPTLPHMPPCRCVVAWMGGTHSCSRACLHMRRSVDGRRPPLLTCPCAHALERGWDSHSLAYVPRWPCARA